MAWYSFRDILTTIKDALLLLEKKAANDDKAVEALVSIQKAILKTRSFITTDGYKPNIDLSELWLAAFDKLKKARIYSERDFPEYLYQKARFWGDPQTWLKEPGAMELVPTLKEVEEMCDNILNKVNNVR